MEGVIGAVILAAGASTRFGSPKQRLLLPRVLERVRAARSLGDIVVVLGAHPVETDARAVECPDWERGPGASLRCGRPLDLGRHPGRRSPRARAGAGCM